MDAELLNIHMQEADRRMNWDDQAGQSRLNAAIEAEEMNLFSLLRPTLSRDGNKWCVLYGEDLQVGIAGFGDTPRLAIYDFNKRFDDCVYNNYPGTREICCKCGEPTENCEEDNTVDEDGYPYCDDCAIGAGLTEGSQ